MPAPYTPTARLRAAAPPLPTNDPKDLATWRTMLDALAHQAQASVNRLAWSGDFSVEPNGSNSSFDVNLGAIYGVTLYDVASGLYLPHLAAGTTIGAAKIEGGGNLANSSWYYVYAWSSTGALDFEISLTGPSASRVRKSGVDQEDLARVYLGCFPTNTAGAPIPLQAVRGRYLYRRSAIASVTGNFAANGLRPVSGTAVAHTALDLSARVPPHAMRALLYGQATITSSSTAASTTINLFDGADTTSTAQEIVAAVANNTETSRNGARAEVQLTGAQVCGYSVVVAGVGGVPFATIDMMGWEE